MLIAVATAVPMIVFSVFHRSAITASAGGQAIDGWKYGAIQICPDGGGYAVSGMDSEASARGAVVQGAEIGHAMRGHGCKTDWAFDSAYLVGLHCERNDHNIAVEEDSYIGKGPTRDIARNDAYKQARANEKVFDDTECVMQVTFVAGDDPKTKPPHWRIPVLR